MKHLYTEEVTRLRSDLQEIKQQAILFPNLHMDESLHLFHVWDFTTKTFEHTSRTLLNNVSIIPCNSFTIPLLLPMLKSTLHNIR